VSEGKREIRVHASLLIRRDDRILIVREGKAEHQGRWNLPGGHLDYEETLVGCARREAREETGLEVELTSLLGVYAGRMRSAVHSIRFVFLADAPRDASPTPGDDITEVRWATSAEIIEMPVDRLVAPAILSRVLSDLNEGRGYPLQLIVEENLGEGSGILPCEGEDEDWRARLRAATRPE